MPPPCAIGCRTPSSKFDETKPTTPLIDRQDGARIEEETGFAPRPLIDGVRAHINEARKEAGLAPV